MMGADVSFGVFEAALSSEQEVGLARQASVDKREAAIYDVREKLGPSLFASRDLQEFRDRVALMKNDQSIYRVIGAHLHPSTGVVRSIVGKNGVIEKEFKVHLADKNDYLKNMGWQQKDDEEEDEKKEKEARRLRALRNAGLLRTADFEGTVDTDRTFSPSDGLLEPDGNFAGYLDSVDQGAPEAVRRNFAGLMYSDWCEANNLPVMRVSSLDTYAANLTDSQYFHLARLLQGCSEMTEHKPKPPGGQSESKLKDVTARRDPLQAYNSWCKANGFKRISARNVQIFAGNDAELCYHLASRVRRAIRVARQRQGRRRTAAPDYLQKADDALTQLLNQKAEEFQQTIAPLQQALVTVQQAEQLAQAANPMNVLPPPGTVNVMPGGDQGEAGMPASDSQDLGAAAQALAGPIGGSPPGGGAEGGPPGGAPGGAPPGGEPEQPPQQMQARRGGQGKGRAVARPRQAGNVFDMWSKWQNQRGQSGNLTSGGEQDYQSFANETGVGQKALNKLRQKHLGPQSPLVASRQRYLAWCSRNHLKAANTKNFYWYLGQVPTREAALLTGGNQGVRKQAWSGWGPAVFPKTRKVAGWDWDNHLNGYIANRPQHFACECGDSFPAPSGFQRCACGRQWNSYVIGTGGNNHQASAEKFLVREIPVRPDVIVANQRLNGTIHDITDPGGMGKGRDDGPSTSFRTPAPDWARRDEKARWQRSPIGG